MSTSSEAAQLDVIVRKVKDSETRLKKIVEERENMLLESEFDSPRIIDPLFIQENLDQLRVDGFRKANLAKKREIVKSVIRSISIHPDNVIKIDVWGAKASVGIQEKDRDTKGVILPFFKLGRPLESSFKTAFFGGERFYEIKKENMLGTTINAGGSSSISNGGR